MTIADFDRLKLRQILQTSQGFPTPRAGAVAKIQTVSGNRVVSPKPVGHPIGSHVRGTDAIAGKTKFCSLDDQADALWLLLNTPEGTQALSALGPGVRQSVGRDLNRLFPVEATVPPHGTVTFSTAEQAAVGLLKTHCVAVLEGRQRGAQLYLHVQTCYPKVGPAQLAALAARRPVR